MFSGTRKILTDSIGFKLLKTVLWAYVLWSCLVVGLQVLAMYQEEKLTAIQNAKHELANVSKMTVADMQVAIENNNAKQLEAVIQQLESNPLVQGIAISNVAHPELNKNIEPDKSALFGKENITYSWDILSTKTTPAKLLGAVSLSTPVDLTFQARMMNVGLAYLLINTLLKILVVGFLLLWASERYVSRPIGQFAEAVGALKLEKLEKISIADAQAEENELKKLQNVFNTLIDNLEIAVGTQKKYQTALEQSERYLNAILNAMPSVLVGVDVGGNVVHWNTAAETMSMMPMKDSLGQPVVNFLPFLQEHLHLIETALKDKTIQTIQKISVVKELEDNEREEKYFNLMVYPVVLDPVGVIIRMDDVTDRIRLENAMVQTEKMTSLGTLSAGIAHEINNPLGGILQGVQNIHRRLDPTRPQNQEIAKQMNVNLEDVLKYMEKREITLFLKGISDLGERAANIVKNVLRFSRASSADMQPVNVHQILESAIAIISTDHDIKRQTDFRKIDIVRIFEPDMPLVPASPLEIEQVLLNLLKNAAHAVMSYNASGEPQIIIQTRKTADKVYIEVQDNGPGIERAVKKRIFEPFFTTKPVGKGTGLGLSISYFIIVDKHRGSLEVESEFGEGTKFIIGLPIRPI